MKKFFQTIFLLLLLFLVFKYYKPISMYLMKNVIYQDDQSSYVSNGYKKQDIWNYIDETDSFEISNKEETKNIFYTALNNGWEEVTFYCDRDYENCIDDVEDLSIDNYWFSNINNFVSPFNSYANLGITINKLGRITISINKTYDSNQITEINKKIDEIYDELIISSMTNEEKIKVIHDYIINNTIYDTERAIEIKNGEDNIKHVSNLAYGVLFNHRALCGGYADTMALFLDKMSIPNCRISSDNHVWNLVYINGSWKHLDLTWDDPVVNTGANRLEYTYYLITDDELKALDTSQHLYDELIYSETKK